MGMKMKRVSRRQDTNRTMMFLIKQLVGKLNSTEPQYHCGDQDTDCTMILLKQVLDNWDSSPRDHCRQDTDSSATMLVKQQVDNPDPDCGQDTDCVMMDEEDYHLYECKTCNKKFSTFQALGGHRTSHRKVTLGNESSKLHACKVCGEEFEIGQALGGHMRKHKGKMVKKEVALAAKTWKAEEESELNFVVGKEVDRLNVLEELEEEEEEGYESKHELILAAKDLRLNLHFANF